MGILNLWSHDLINQLNPSKYFWLKSAYPDQNVALPPPPEHQSPPSKYSFKTILYMKQWFDNVQTVQWFSDSQNLLFKEVCHNWFKVTEISWWFYILLFTLQTNSGWIFKWGYFGIFCHWLRSIAKLETWLCICAWTPDSSYLCVHPTLHDLFSLLKIWKTSETL